MKRLVAVCVVALLALAVGCKEKSSAEKGQEALKQVKVPETPDKVVTEAIAAVKAGNFIAVYAMLPDSYQKDVQALYKKFGDKLDAEMWGKIWGTLDKAVAAAKKHKDKLAQGAPVPPAAFDVAEQFVALAKECKLNDGKAMKELDVAGFLADNGKKLSDFGWKTADTFAKKDADEAKKMLDSIKAEVKETKENDAIVILSMGEEKQEIPFVKIEGKWIPKPLADEWKKGIEEANKNLDEGLAQLEKNKAQIDGMLKGLDEAITKFDASGNPADVMGSIGPMMGGMMGGPRGMPEEPPVEAPVEAPAEAPVPAEAPAPASN